MDRVQRRKIKKRKKIKKTVLSILLVFSLVIIITGVYVFYHTIQAANKAYDDLGREKSNLREETVTIGKDPFSILIIGIEDYSSGGVNGRTDALMVATFNPNDERMKLLSIPRDTLVDIVGYGKKDKINHAHVWGGKKMTIETVENFLGIPIDYYAAVDFDAFVNIIDIMGGVTVDVPFDFSEMTMDKEIIQFYKGEMHLNGEEALAYVRMRMHDPEGDIGRNKRQQQVLKAVIDKLFSFNVFSKIDELANAVGENVTTNMKIKDGIALIKEHSNFSTDKIDSIKLETTSDWYNGMSVQIPDEESLAEVQSILKEHLELEQTKNVTQN